MNTYLNNINMGGSTSLSRGLDWGKGTVDLSKGRLEPYRLKDPYTYYAFYADFTDGKGGLDRVSKQKMQTNIPAGNRYLLDGTVLGQNQPAIEPGLGLRGVKEIGNLCARSNNFNPSAGIGYFQITNAQIIDNTTLLATGLNGRALCIIAAPEGTPITISFDAWTDIDHPNGSFSVYAYRGLPLETIIPVSSVRTRFTVTVIVAPGQTGIYVGPKDMRTSDWTQLHLANFQVTQSKYQLPYVPTTTAPITTPSEVSQGVDGYGNFFAMSGLPKLVDALDGKADGVELIPAPIELRNGPFTMTSGTNIGINGNTIVKDATSTARGVLLSTVPGKRYLLLSTWTSTAGMAIYNHNFNPENPLLTSSGVVSFVALYNAIYFRSTTDGTSVFSQISLKQISPAKGELQLEWTPAYPSTGIANLARLPLINLGIVSPGMLDTLMTTGVNAANSSDGTSAVSVTPAGWAAGETQKLKLCWGEKDGALKKQLFLNGAASALVDFDGSYTIADNLHLFFNNPELNYLKSIKVRKEPTWTA